MKRSRRIVALILCAIMCLVLMSACGKDNGDNGSNDTAVNSPNPSPSPAASPNAPEPGAPSVNLPSGPDPAAPPPEDNETRYAEHIDMIMDNNTVAVINPFNNTGGTPGALWTYKMIYDTLLTDEGDGVYGPDLAARYETDDFITFTFYLRDDVTFHNGDKFTSADVLWTIECAKEAVGTTAFDSWRPVVDAAALDEYTVQVVLDGVNVNFLYGLTLPQTGIVNQRAMQGDPENGVWIGTGAFYMTGFSTNDYISVARNDAYWGQLPYTQSLKLQFIPEVTTRTIMMQNGEYQVCFAIGAEDLIIFQNDSDFNVFPIAYNNPNTVSFNMDHPICGDWNFRMAVASALDREEIAVVAAGDWAAPVEEGTMWGYATEFRNSDIPLIPYDLDAARAYLAESPYNGEVIELTTAITTNVRASEVIQQQLAAVGISVRINEMDPPSVAAYTAWDDNKMEMMMFVTALTTSAANVRSIYYPGAVNNRYRFNNPAINDILDRATSVTDVNERRALYQELQAIAAADPPCINVFWRLQGMVGCKGIGGLVLRADNYFDLRYIYWILDD